MEGANAEFFNNRNNLDHSRDSSVTQDLLPLPYCPNSISTLSHHSIALHSTSSDSFNEPYPLLDDCAFLTAPYTSTSSVPLQFIESFPQAFPNARSQHFTAQVAGPSQFLQPLQAPDNFWPPFSMSDIGQDQQECGQTTEPASPDENAPLKCTFRGCPEQQLFPTKSAMKRHQDKHIRPYVCNHTSCNRKSFGDKGGLERHKREVHGSQAYICPVLSCKRNKKGFHRRYNLLEHQKRAHSLQPSSFPQAGSNILDELSEGEEKALRPQYETGAEELNEGEVGSTGELRGDASLNSEQDFRRKLRDLRIMRAELDEDIRSMERALSIMGGASP